MTASVWITLESWEDIHAHAVGTARHYANASRSHRATWDKNRMQADNNQADIDAARAEVAVARAYGGYWHAGHWSIAEHKTFYDKHPDITARRYIKGYGAVGFGIEVKRRRSGTRISLDEKDYLRDHVIVWAQVYGCDGDNEYPRVEIIGEARAQKIWDLAKPWKDNDKRRWISRELLQDPKVLEEYAIAPMEQVKPAKPWSQPQIRW
jgi:hypothetical protein